MSSAEPVIATPSSFLTAAEPPPYSLDNAASRRPVLVVCDHASNRLPAAVGDLGLESQYLQQHIAWDVGAAGVARELGSQLDARVIFGGYSRLVIDLNRSTSDVGAVPTLSDGILIPGNLGLSAAAREARIAHLFDPYHAVIASHLKDLANGGAAPVLISIHSFTPFLHGLFRPWDIGVLWDKDPRIPVPLLAALRSNSGLVIGDNVPYSGMHTADYTVDVHAEAAGLAHVGIEIRQDHIAAAGGQRRFADLLADALAPILRQDALFVTR